MVYFYLLKKNFHVLRSLRFWLSHLMQEIVWFLISIQTEVTMNGDTSSRYMVFVVSFSYNFFVILIIAVVTIVSKHFQQKSYQSSMSCKSYQSLSSGRCTPSVYPREQSFIHRVIFSIVMPKSAKTFPVFFPNNCEHLDCVFHLNGHEIVFPCSHSSRL